MFRERRQVTVIHCRTVTHNSGSDWTIYFHLGAKKTFKITAFKSGEKTVVKAVFRFSPLNDFPRTNYMSKTTFPSRIT